MKNNIGSAPIDWADKLLSLVEEGASNAASAAWLLALIPTSHQQPRIEALLQDPRVNSTARAYLLSAATKQRLRLGEDSLRAVLASYKAKETGFDWAHKILKASYRSDQPTVARALVLSAPVPQLHRLVGVQRLPADQLPAPAIRLIYARLVQLHAMDRSVAQWTPKHRRSRHILAASDRDWLFRYRSQIPPNDLGTLIASAPELAGLLLYRSPLDAPLATTFNATMHPVYRRTHARWTLLHCPTASDAIQAVCELNNLMDIQTLQKARKRPLPTEIEQWVTAHLLVLTGETKDVSTLDEQTLELAFDLLPTPENKHRAWLHAAIHDSRGSIAYQGAQHLLTLGEVLPKDIAERWKRNKNIALQLTAFESDAIGSNEGAIDELERIATGHPSPAVRALALGAVRRCAKPQRAIECCIQALRNDRQVYEDFYTPVLSEAANGLHRRLDLAKDVALRTLIEAILDDAVSPDTRGCLMDAIASWFDPQPDPPQRPLYPWYLKLARDCVIKS